MATITSIKQRISQLDAGSFQILCDAYLSREGYHNIVALGTMAGSQKTTKGTPDTYFCENNGKYVLVEYTTKQTGLDIKIREDLDKCFDESNTGLSTEDIIEIIYCFASSNLNPGTDKSLKQFCLDKGVQLTLISIDQLSEDIYRRYPVLAKEHLNLTIDTEQIQSLEDYIKTYDANKLAAPLKTEFHFREKEMDGLKRAIAEEDVVLVTGAAGTGKTRIALEYAEQYTKEIRAISYVIHDRGLQLFADLKLYFETPGKYVVVIDDANHLSELDLIIDYVNKRTLGYSVKFLITVRNYALQKIKEEIIGKARFKIVEIPPFTDEEIEYLVKSLFGIINPDYLERIKTIAQGNARIAMIAGKIASDENRLSAIKDVTGLYEEYYGSAFREANLDENQQIQITAGVIAFLNSIHLDYMGPLLPLLARQGVDQIAFRRCVQMLNELELVDVCQDTAVAISDQCFANYILKRVFVDVRTISLAEMIDACFEQHRQRSIQAVNTLNSVFQSQEVHNFVSQQIRSVWEKRKTKGGDQYWDWVKAFYPANQEEALALIWDRIDNIRPVIIQAQNIDVNSRKNYESVDDDVLRILGGYAYSENIDTALDLLFEYYNKRPDLYIQFYHTINLYYGVRIESINTGFVTQIHLIDHFEKYSNGWQNELVKMLFFDIAKKLLQIEYTQAEPSRTSDSIQYRQFSLTTSCNASVYRKQLWAQILCAQACSECKASVIEVLEAYPSGGRDASRGIIRDDATFIIQLISKGFSLENVQDCILAEQLSQTLVTAGCDVATLRPYIISEKLQIYHLLAPKWDYNKDYEEYELEMKQGIINSLEAAEDSIDTFQKMFEIYLLCTQKKNHQSYEIGNGIMVAISHLLQKKANIEAITRTVVASGATEGINFYFITGLLFSYFEPNCVKTIIDVAPQETKDHWLFAFYQEYPENLIVEDTVEELYAYFRSDQDRYLSSAGYRRLDFLKKYQKIDDDVFIKSVRLILAKKEYSHFIVDVYFTLLFNDHAYSPQKIIKQFEKDRTLLKEVYFFEAFHNKLADCAGSFLKELCSLDIAIAKEYVRIDAAQSRLFRDENTKRLQALYDSTRFIEILDTIALACKETEPIPFCAAFSMMEAFVVVPKSLTEKRDEWITHFIGAYNTDSVLMECLFEEIMKLPDDYKISFIKMLVELTSDSCLFSKIPLIPSSCSWSGSAIPVYAGWIDYLNKLLPLFPGIKYLQHKKRIKDTIERLSEEIKQAEIKELLGG